jgi:23S rRNA (uracil1939-C5)-methyltransferase
MQEIILKSYSKKGHAQCERYEVKGAFAGEKALVEPTKRKKRGRRLALLVEILEKHNERIEPRCKHAETCGGCTWQALNYPEQLKIKQNLIDSLFDVKSHAICGGPQWQYRGKMQFSFSQDREGNRYLGLMQKEGRGRVINISECSICDPWFAQTLKKAQCWYKACELEAFHPRKGTGALRELTLRKAYRGSGKMVILTVAGSAVPSKLQLNTFVEALDLDENTSVFLLIHSAIKGRVTEFFEIHLRGPQILEENLIIKDRQLKFQISPQAFFQPNVQMAEKIIEKIIDTLPKGCETVVDLCCGIGTIGMSMSYHVKEVIGAEIMAESVCDAKECMRLNNISNMRVLKCDMKDFSLFQQADCIVIDPPRSGIHPKTLEALGASKVQQISYLSCNPYTQAEDVKVLKEFGYTIKNIYPFDQFAHTPHVENLITLNLIA